MQRTLTILLWWLCIPFVAAFLMLAILVPFPGVGEVYEVAEISDNNVHEEQEEVPQSLSILFVGDMMFDRGVARRSKEYGLEWLLEDVEDLFLDSDMVVGNLEGTITKFPSVAQVDNTILRFTFDPLVAPLLKKYNFSAVSLANNHSSDFGEEGYLETKKYLDNEGVQFFGTALNNKVLSTTLEEGKERICLIGYHDNFLFNSVSAFEEIERTKVGCTFVVLFAHWGEEYKTVQNERQENLAHAFIDAGVDLVIGAHPHVVQPLEIYNGRAIFYSLGNFIFDQYFSFNTTHGVAVRLVLDTDEIRFELFPVDIDYGKVTRADASASARVLKALTNSTLSDKISVDIRENTQFTIKR